jgi:hypothetical protein
MGLSVTTPATKTALTTKARVKLEVSSIPASDHDALLDELIAAATVAIEAYCNRAKAPFARQAYSETLGAFGDTWLMLSGTPVVVVASVLQDGSAITDYVIDDALAGMLQRKNQFFATAQLYPGLGGRQTFPTFGAPIPGAEERRFTVAYTAGYLVPEQNLAAKTTISASSTDNSFNDSAAGFPPLLKAGDIITVSGFADSANVGRFVVSGTPTTSKVPVTATLVTGAAGASVDVDVANLPADLEKAAVETVKSWYLDREKSSHVKRERIGATDTEYADPLSIRTGLPVAAVGFLRAYTRAA